MQKVERSLFINEYGKDIALISTIVVLLIFIFYARYGLYISAENAVNLGIFTIGWNMFRNVMVALAACVCFIWLHDKPLRYKYLLLGLLLGYYGEYICHSDWLHNGILTYIEWGWK